MATSLVCQITEKDYDVFLFSPGTPRTHLTSSNESVQDRRFKVVTGSFYNIYALYNKYNKMLILISGPHVSPGGSFC